MESSTDPTGRRRGGEAMGTPDVRMIAAVADHLPEHVAVIDRDGWIEWVNRTWIDFGRANGAPPDFDWIGQNYLHSCRPGSDDDADPSGAVRDGVGRVARGALDEFTIEYPCHGNGRQRWFLMRAVPMRVGGLDRIVISHHDITQRRLAELDAQRQAGEDGLTGVANRRRFDAFLADEWSRAMRRRRTLALVMFDLDAFKDLNDAYGHLAGDDCLRRVAGVLARHARRPGDLLARFGGEEFALVLAETTEEQARRLAERALLSVARLAIRHPDGGPLTTSAGVAAVVPARHEAPRLLVRLADRGLYEAKESGGNCVRVGSPQPVLA